MYNFNIIARINSSTINNNNLTLNSTFEIEVIV